MAERMPTAIDAALCRPLIGAVMEQFDRGIRGLTGGTGLGDFAYGRVHHLPAALQFALPDQPYQMFEVTIDLGEASRGGSLHLALPLAVIEPVEAVLRRQGMAPAGADSDDWARHMRKVVGGMRVSLTAVLDRGLMPVAELTRLEAGGLFPLRGRTLDDVGLELAVDGSMRRIAHGRLGALGRNKAVKLTEAPDPAFLAPLGEALEARSPAPVAQPGPDHVPAAQLTPGDSAAKAPPTPTLQR